MPTIPPEGAYTEAELRFIEAQPPGLWPENQDSNFGQLRKVLMDLVQARRDEIEMIAAERFPVTADNYLDLWEEMLGAAIDPSGKTLDQRRAVITSRLKYGAFTRSQLKAIIEGFLGTTSGGTPAVFGPGGIPILGGIPLYGSSGPVDTLYRVYERPLDYAYDVWIDAANVPDTTALSRELSRVTPAGITYNIDTAHTGTGLIDWGKTVTSLGPSGWWKLAADYLDSSGLGHTGTVTGAPAAITSPGLVLSAGADAARDFSGSGQYVTISDSPRLDSEAFSVHAIVRPDTIQGSDSYRYIFGLNSINDGLIMYRQSGAIHFGLLVTAQIPSSSSASAFAQGTTTPVAGTVYRVVGVWDGDTAKIYVNGVLEGQAQLAQSVAQAGNRVTSGSKQIAADGTNGNLWDGGLDEIMYFGYALSDAQALYLSKQARNIL